MSKDRNRLWSWSVTRNLSKPKDIIFECELCKQSFGSNFSLKRHITRIHRSNHDNNDANTFTCDVCDKVFKRKHHFQRHKSEVHRINGKIFSCNVCEQTFTRKSGLKRHEFEVHRLNNGSDNEMFICGLCEKTFRYKRILAQHIRIHYPRTSVECAICQYTCASKGRLLSHIQQHHRLVIDESSMEYYECDNCSTKYTDKSTLKYHIQTVHSLEKKQSNINKLQAVCLRCNAKFQNRKAVFKHYEEVHNDVLQFEYLSFNSMEEFLSWKIPCYRRIVTRKTSVYNVQKFHCHRSGFYTDSCNGNRRRHLKLYGSKKLQGCCPGEVTVKERRSDGFCIVAHQRLHIGHSVNDVKELKYIGMSKTDRQKIALQLQNGVPKDAIPGKINQIYNKNNDDTNRLRIVNDQDVKNVAASLGLKSCAISKKDSKYIVDKFILDYNDSILFFKKQNSKDTTYNVFSEEDLVIIYQDKLQQESFVKYGQKLVAFDATRGTNPNDFLLHTLLVVDTENKCIPVAFLITNRNDQAVMDVFIRCIKDRNGVMNTTTLMTNTDKTYDNSWQSIMGAPKFCLYCPWQVHEAWENQIQKLVPVSGRLRKLNNSRMVNASQKNRQQIIANVKAKLNDLANELDEFSFLTKLADFLNMNDKILKPFIDYFRSNYANNVELWAKCYRLNTGVNVNVEIEAFRKILKHKIGKGLNIPTLPRGLQCIHSYIRYRVQERDVKFIKPVITPKLRLLRQRHRQAENYAKQHSFTISYDISSKIWQVGSFCETNDGVQEMYSIQKNETKECASSPESCLLLCTICNSCLHEYSCSCNDSAISHNMCKHIHALSFFHEHNEQIETTVIVPSLNDNYCIEDPQQISEMLIEEPMSSTITETTKPTNLEDFKNLIKNDFAKAAEKVLNIVNVNDETSWLELRRQLFGFETGLEAMRQNEPRFQLPSN